MNNYIKVIDSFQKANCQLLTSFEEFEERRKTSYKNSYQFVRVDFIGECLHLSSAVFTNFKLRKTGIICKECIIKESKTMQRMNDSEIEQMGIKILEEYLTEYEMKRTKEGCRADLAIKNQTDDLWIPIQIKTTMKQCHNMYSFKQCNKDYSGMLIICICISEKKLWIIPFSNEIKININISLKSKYDKYYVENDKISEAIEGYRSKVNMAELEMIMKPISILQQREQEYVQKRETLVSFLTYDYPEIQGQVYDFICNGKKVQEKVLGLYRKELHCTFAVNNGSKGKKRLFRTYMLGENDYYWFHSSVDERFWIIPERVLYEKGFISIEKTNKKDIRFSGEWNEYMYHYDNIDKERIMTLFYL